MISSIAANVRKDERGLANACRRGRRAGSDTPSSRRGTILGPFGGGRLARGQRTAREGTSSSAECARSHTGSRRILDGATFSGTGRTSALLGHLRGLSFALRAACASRAGERQLHAGVRSDLSTDPAQDNGRPSVLTRSFGTQGLGAIRPRNHSDISDVDALSGWVSYESCRTLRSGSNWTGARQRE